MLYFRSVLAVLALLAFTTGSQAKTKFKDWSGACSQDLLLAQAKGSCDEGDATSYEKGRCKEAQRHLRKSGTLYYMPNVYRSATYDARRKRFTVEIRSWLAGEIQNEDCWTDGCETNTISTTRFPNTGGKRSLAKWSKLFTGHIARMLKTKSKTSVKASTLLAPESFESNLRVEALVKLVAADSANVTREDFMGEVAGYWVSNIQVKIVGLRLSTDGEKFNKVFKAGRDLPSDYCRIQLEKALAK